MPCMPKLGEFWGTVARALCKRRFTRILGYLFAADSVIRERDDVKKLRTNGGRSHLKGWAHRPRHRKRSHKRVASFFPRTALLGFPFRKTGSCAIGRAGGEIWTSESEVRWRAIFTIRRGAATGNGDESQQGEAPSGRRGGCKVRHATGTLNSSRVGSTWVERALEHSPILLN